ncbi:MAG: imidazolonepropionase [Acidobacteriota bacterium]
MPAAVDLLVHSAGQLVTCASPEGPKRGAAMADVGIVPEGAVAIEEGRIVAVGRTSELLSRYVARQKLDAGGKVVCPGFVDPHTHVVYAGDRVGEFEQRIGGATYMEILASGGGILSTVQATRAATGRELYEASLARLDQMLALGTTTVESKSGYGLDGDTELKLLQTMAAVDEAHPVDLVPTFLGAHAVPAEYRNRTDAYVDLVVEDMLPAVSGWYEESSFRRRDVSLFVDVFCEAGVFDERQAARVLEAGQERGMPVKAHTDEFVSLGGVTMAVKRGAVSVDHLDATGVEEIEVLAASTTVGVVLPAVNFNLGSRDFADARTMVDRGVALALGTDINPGSAPCFSVPLVMAIACRYQGLRPAEALNASTIHAAHAVGMAHRIGSIEVGKQADLLICATDDYRQLAYRLGDNLVEGVVKRGVFVQR